MAMRLGYTSERGRIQEDPRHRVSMACHQADRRLLNGASLAPLFSILLQDVRDAARDQLLIDVAPKPRDWNGQVLL